MSDQATIATERAREHEAVSLLRASSGEPVSEFRLLAFGDVKLDRPTSGRDFHFSRGHAEQALRWFESVGRKLAIDYEHQTFGRFNTRPDGLRPAAGWIGGLEMREDGLWATNVNWTARAAQLIRAGEYRYFSPVIFWADEDYSVLDGLGPVALTNDPAMCGVTALMMRRPEVDVDSGGAASDAEREVQVLRGKLAAQEADAFVERGMRLGKIVEATSMDWREDYLRDAVAATKRLERSPVVLPPGRIVRHDDAVTGRLTDPLLDAWGVDAEDLSACERAVAAGRVRGL